ncbi:NAD(P)-dependent oxidoreductase [Mycobacterium sp. URHB0044]|uniref:NAD(P)-dependent oxidoreductase n=1 Tax=Mycobacterium sp. URHB0044 TaxID=1380386 RepID=UPI000491A60D|nr:NAD(P)-binding domain-containing protein [Mycobacterium sp. URHB0044]
MITLIGLGPMGQAMVRAFAKAGHEVTVWNRTPSKAEGLDATVAPTVADALAASDVVFLSLTDYQVMFDLLDGQDVGGKTIINLSSDTPATTRRAAEWASTRGATLIVGGVMVPEELIATDAAYTFYSGPEPVVRQHESLLSVIGRVEYVGEDPALAQLFYQAQLTIFLTSLSAYMHATALVGSAGVAPETFLRHATETFDNLSYYLPDAAKNIATHEHPGEGANIVMMGATADHIVGASTEAKLDLALPQAVKSLYDRAIAAGHGADTWTSLYEVIEP